MVARIISGKDLRGALSYNEHKVKEHRATCILASAFHGRPEDMNFYDKYSRLKCFTDKNTRVKTNAIHISLNFDAGEKLGEDQLKEISALYMNKIGFGNQPYLVYEHKDAAHPHIHIITTNIQFDGKRIDIHNIGRNQSEVARKEIEAQFNLVKAESKKNKNQHKQEFLRPVDLQKTTYGKSETKRSISNIVSTIIRTYRYTSIPELNAVLNQYHVQADRGKEGSMMHQNKGLQYSLIDEIGNKVGVPIKASSIDGKPTLAFLEKQFQLNIALRKPHRESLRRAIDNTFRSDPKDGVQWQKRLRSRNIQLVIRSNPEGRVYGVTYIDHKTSCVFNGSDLGKQYTAKGILDRLSQIEQSQPFRPGYSEVKRPETKAMEFSKERTDLQLEKLLWDLIKPEQQEYVSPEAAMRLKKKRRRIKKGRSI